MTATKLSLLLLGGSIGLGQVHAEEPGFRAAQFPVNTPVPPAPEYRGRPTPPAPEPGTRHTRPDLGSSRLPGSITTRQSQDDKPALPDQEIDKTIRRLEEEFRRLPTKKEVFRLEPDALMEDRILKELNKADREENRFPPAPKLVPDDTVYEPKTLSYPSLRAEIEPGYVIHRRLYFQELNSERHGWDLGILQPAASSLVFYKDILFWPAKVASNHKERYDVSAGYCPPGTPVPLYIYPEEIDLFGFTVAAGMYTGLAFFLP